MKTSAKTARSLVAPPAFTGVMLHAANFTIFPSSLPLKEAAGSKYRDALVHGPFPNAEIVVDPFLDLLAIHYLFLIDARATDPNKRGGQVLAVGVSLDDFAYCPTKGQE